MRRPLLSIFAVVLLMVGLASEARAANPAWASGAPVCIMGSFTACVSFEGFSYNAATKTVSFRLVNLAPTEGVYHKITSFGFYREGTTFNGYVTAFGGPSGWSPVPPCPSGMTASNCSEVYNNGSGAKIEFGADTDGIASGIGPASYGDFTLTLSESFVFDEYTQLRWHSQDVSGAGSDISYKCDTGWTDSDGVDSSFPPCNVVPEPFTIALLGSGLAGMGGVGMLRRRKKA